MLVPVIVVGCANPGPSKQGSVASEGSINPSIADLSSESIPVPTEESPVVTYHGGLLRFELPSAEYAPIMSAEEALQKFKAAGLFLDAAQYSEPVVGLALYTNLSSGVRRADGGLDLSHVREPVWIVAFRSYPVHSSGGAGGQDSTSEPAVLEDVVSIFSDKDGSSISVLIDVPDQPPVRDIPSEPSDQKGPGA